MDKSFRVAIISDIHYAADEERQLCANYDYRREVKNPVARVINKLFHRYIWLREIGGHNHRLDQFIAAANEPDLVVANGDYSCNVRSCGMNEAAAFASAAECLGKLRSCFEDKFHPVFGDHELGKTGLFTGRGAMNLASWHAAVDKLKIEPFWRVQFGKYILVGAASSLIALPVFKAELLPEEMTEWEMLRKIHLEKIRDTFANLKADERILLFCHDPTALPFLAKEQAIRERLSQVEQTIIGHLHSKLVLWGSGILSGLPTISFLGKGARRISAALGEAKFWKPFHVRLCPSPFGIQLLKDGGFLTVDLDAGGNRPAHFEFHPLKW